LLYFSEVTVCIELVVIPPPVFMLEVEVQVQL